MARKVPSIFIAHSQADARFAEDLTRGLVKQGLRVSSDSAIKPGDSWPYEIERKIKAADVVLLLISPHFLLSPSSNFEAGVALARQTPSSASLQSSSAG